MYESERAQIRVLSTWADSQRLDHVRDLLNMAESEIREHVEHRERIFCTKDVGDGTTMYDTRPRG